MTRCMDMLEAVIRWTVVLLLAVMVAAIGSQVFARYLFHQSLYWTEELGKSSQGKIMFGVRQKPIPLNLMLHPVSGTILSRGRHPKGFRVFLEMIYSHVYREEIAAGVAALKEQSVTPGLAVVLVGNDPASQVYVAMKEKAGAAAGIFSDEHKLPAETTVAQLLALIEELNRDRASMASWSRVAPSRADRREQDPRSDLAAKRR